MSLHTVAAHLAQKGRGPDDHLIHMSGKELAGLQALARAHGGSLTTNPQTGLPEAGILDSILPAVIGAGLAVAFPEASLFGLSAPASIGLGMGALGTLATGNLNKGLTAGLGAYGGAGLVGGLTSQAGTAAAQDAVNRAAATSPEFTSFQATKELPGAFGEAAGSAATAPSVDEVSQAQKTLKAAAALTTGDLAKYGIAAAAPIVANAMVPTTVQMPGQSSGLIRPYTLNRQALTPSDMVGASYTPGQSTSERRWFEDTYTPGTPYRAPGPEYTMTNGGPVPYIQGSPARGSVEQMSNANAVGQNTGYPQANITQGAYATPWQTPISRNMLEGAADTGVNPISGEMNFASGGLSDLGGYSDGGRLLRGPGDGVSDSIPAVIGQKQPARLADGEFVVPARVV